MTFKAVEFFFMIYNQEYTRVSEKKFKKIYCKYKLQLLLFACNAFNYKNNKVNKTFMKFFWDHFVDYKILNLDQKTVLKNIYSLFSYIKNK